MFNRFRVDVTFQSVQRLVADVHVRLAGPFPASENVAGSLIWGRDHVVTADPQGRLRIETIGRDSELPDAVEKKAI